jgi:hypothetical protein
MENRISGRTEGLGLADTDTRRAEEPRPIGEVLEELLSLYQIRFPGFRLAIVETPVNAL